MPLYQGRDQTYGRVLENVNLYASLSAQSHVSCGHPAGAGPTQANRAMLG